MKNFCSISIFLLLTFSIMQFSCIGEGGGTIGPCEHTYKEPILHIEWTRNVQTGDYLRTIILSDIRIDTVKADLQLLISESNHVAILDSSLVCNPPCAFGILSGRYSFRVSAAGCRDTVIVCYPAYTINKGGCPSSSDGGSRINITLQSN